MGNKVLISEAEISVRFSETDAMGVVWHGEYIKYFEDGRKSFGDKYGLSYEYFYKNGVFVPVVKIECEYKKSLSFGDKANIITKFINCETAKVIFEYEIYSFAQNELTAKGRSEQVFTDTSHNLLLYPPDFYMDWKKKWDLV